MDKKQIGALGEEFAGKYFQRLGYKVSFNYHSRYGEIDLIAENEEHILFIEVKTRRDGSMVSPVQAVDERKQKKILLTAVKYLSESGGDKQSRFDVFEVFQHEGRIYKFNHIESAFDATFLGESHEFF